MARSPQGAGPTTASLRGSEAIQRAHAQTGLLRRFAPRNDGKTNLIYRPGRSSRLSSPAATLSPTWPCTLSGCSAIEFAEPPTSTLPPSPTPTDALPRSEEHTSELQSRLHLVCRLLLEKKKQILRELCQPQNTKSVKILP